jgi:hypothetical protein
MGVSMCLTLDKDMCTIGYSRDYDELDASR